ncbi:hypothetical protein CSUB01_09563 [Colletotrichum sublineola]|uniref:Uncharacterized protein n=1 Tax=Colletotrichum sublineola TaxID=1173701 RepID=A0A066XGZ1_COLSU|nr:hypothetical protein CSUB01_09563 [Colletotrichum sublineola]
MTRNRQYNNGSNRNYQTPRNNGQHNGSFNNGLKHNTPLNKSPRNGGNQFPRGPRNTNFYNRVSRNNGNNNNYNSRNDNPNNNYTRRKNFSLNTGNSSSADSSADSSTSSNGSPNGNSQGVMQSSPPGQGHSEGSLTINNNLYANPAPSTLAPNTFRSRKQAPENQDDRSRLEQRICDYYGISGMDDLLKDPSHAPEKWDNSLLNKICRLRDHGLSLPELKDGIHNKIRERIRKGSSRSDKAIKPYIIPQDLVALIKEGSPKEQPEPEAATTNPTPNKSTIKTPPSTVSKKRTRSSAAVVSEQPSSTKRQRRAYASPESSDDSDVESVDSVIILVTDAEITEQTHKLQQEIARLDEANRAAMAIAAAVKKEAAALARMTEQRARHGTGRNGCGGQSTGCEK